MQALRKSKEFQKETELEKSCRNSGACLSQSDPKIYHNRRITQRAYVSVPGPSLPLPAKAQTLPDCRPVFIQVRTKCVKVVSPLFLWVYVGHFGKVSRPYQVFTFLHANYVLFVPSEALLKVLIVLCSLFYLAS